MPRVVGYTEIYGLMDPTIRIIRYVGKTVIGLEERLKGHIRHVEKDQSRKWSHAQWWIRSLLTKGLRPEIILLEMVPNAVWEEAERKWIKNLREAGCNLTNKTDGGDGTFGCVPSAETRKRLSVANKGRVVSQETRRKISEAQIGKIIPKESRERMSIAHKNKTLSKEQRMKMQIGLVRHWENNEEARKKHSKALIKFWQERRECLGDGVPLRAPHSKESNAKVGKTNRERWANGQISEQEFAARAIASAKLRGIPRPQEVRDKISQKLKRRKLMKKRKQPPPFTEEHRRHLSEAQRRRYV